MVVIFFVLTWWIINEFEKYIAQFDDTEKNRNETNNCFLTSARFHNEDR